MVDGRNSGTGGGRIEGSLRQTWPTIARVIVARAVAVRLYVRVARVPEPKPIIR